MSSTMNHNRVCHFKLVLLGDTAVGKSCLVVRFVRDEFFEFQEPTIGGEACSMMLLVLSVVESIFSCSLSCSFLALPVPVCSHVHSTALHVDAVEVRNVRKPRPAREYGTLLPVECWYCSWDQTRTKHSSASRFNNREQR